MDRELCGEIVRVLMMEGVVNVVYKGQIDESQVDRVLTMLKAQGCQNVLRDQSRISFRRLPM